MARRSNASGLSAAAFMAGFSSPLAPSSVAALASTEPPPPAAPSPERSPSSGRQLIDPATAAESAREMHLAAGNIELANALLLLADAYREAERLRRELATAQTEERSACIALVDGLAEEFRRGCETDWEYGARQAASVLRGRR